jgi:hypothetical protein
LSLHNYLYTHDDPISYTDPSGKFVPILLLALGIGCIGAGFLYMATDNYNAAADSLAKSGFDFSEFDKYSATGGTYECVGRFLGTVSFVLAAAPLTAPIYGGVGSIVTSYGGGTAAKIGFGAVSVGLIDKLLLDSFLYTSGVNSSAFSDYYDHPFWSFIDLLLGTITAGLANGWTDIATSLKVFDNPAVISRSILEPIGYGIEPRSFNNLATRLWYNKELPKIRSRLNTSISLEEQAKQASAFRNEIKAVARDLMSDRVTAAELILNRPALSWDQIVAKYQSKGLYGDALWEEIIEASMRPNEAINALFGL